MRSLMLGTIEAAGMPLVSYAPFARDDSGDLLIAVSALAAHQPALATAHQGRKSTRSPSHAAYLEERRMADGGGWTAETGLLRNSDYVMFQQVTVSTASRFSPGSRLPGQADFHVAECGKGDDP